MPQLHVAVRPGDGLIARSGETVIAIGDDAADEVATALLDALEGAEGEPWTALPHRLIESLEAGRAPTFGLVCLIANRVLVLLRGSARAEVVTVEGVETLRGDRSLTWLDRQIDPPVDHIAVSIDGHDLAATRRSDLRAGQVPGGGFVVTVSASEEQAAGPPSPVPVASPPAPDTNGAPADPGSPAPAAAPPARATVVTAPPVDRPQSRPTVVTRPVAKQPKSRATVVSKPTAAATGTPAGGTPSRATVITGPAAAPRAPTDATVAADGPTPLPPKPAALAPTEPVGALVADDGSQLLLDRSYVIGREPHNDARVRAGSAVPIVIDDPDGLISRVQVYVTVTDQVRLQDASSANGTFIAAAGALEWTRLGADEAVLAVGWSMRIGKRIFTHATPS